jgi:alginate O-acetyltransferase complex protein AlgI
MVFSSTIFIFAFLPFVLGGYYLLKESYRNIFLLLVSLVFYAWGEPKFIWIMIISIAINYLFGILINVSKNKLGRAGNRIVLSLGVGANLILLFYFKYYNFFVENVNKIPGIELMAKNVALPIGISFFTFQGMSYILDLYMDNVKVQKIPFKYCAIYLIVSPANCGSNCSI